MSLSTQLLDRLNTEAIVSPKVAGRIEGLDALRAVACLAVVASHSTGMELWSMGHYGVCLFCVLSGYLIMTLLLAEERKSGRIDIMGFWQRRSLRIVPMYFLVLTVCFIALKAGFVLRHQPDAVAGTLANMPFISTFTCTTGQRSIMTHFWSISVEEQFYCIVPLLLICIRNKSARKIALLVVATFSCQFFYPQLRINQAFLPLAAGAIMALSGKVLSKPSLLPTLLTAICFLAFSYFVEAHPYGIAASLGFCCVVACASSVNLPSVFKPMLYVGRISYGIYLIHFPLTFAMVAVMDKLGYHSALFGFLTTTAVSITLASVSWKTIEKPIISMKDTVRANRFGIILGSLSPFLVGLGCLLHLVMQR